MAVMVKDEGARSSRIVLIGEAPGKWEIMRGRPFVGPSGQLQERWWREVGLHRSDFYITNVYPYRPPGNKIKLVPPRELNEWTRDLHRRLGELADPWLIVPTGDTALQALIGKSGITKHRGSIYEYVDANGRRIKVIPTIHPAATYRQPAYTRKIRQDWRRIASDLDFRDLRLPYREHMTRPTLADIADFVQDATCRAELLSVDIETPPAIEDVPYTDKRGRIKMRRVRGEAQIACIGFSFEPHFSMTIPTTEEHWSGGALDFVWEAIRELCALPCPKTLQNGLYDAYWLTQAEYLCPLRNYRYDTLGLHHAIDANSEHDLAYLCSVDLRHQYHKDEAKDPDAIAKYASSWEALLVYNGIDACVQRELADIYIARLHDAGRLPFYERHYADLYMPLLRLMLHGVKMDKRVAQRRSAKLTAECVGIQDGLTAIAGETLYGKKSLSTTKLKRFLYETLRLPKQYAKNALDEKVVTTGEVAIRRLMLRFPKRDDVQKAGGLILEHRRKAQLATFYGERRMDPDGYYRSSYAPYAITGRLRSSKNPKGTGGNGQNIDRESRDVFVPDAGCIFLSVDLSQAEDRVVKCLTGDAGLIERARAKPWENDEHDRASAILFYPEMMEELRRSRFFLGNSRVSKEKRQFGKKTRHANNYKEGASRMSDDLLKEGFIIPPEECQVMLDTLNASEPEIGVWQRRVRAHILQDQRLTTSWGRELLFQGMRMDEATFGEGYAFVPQSEVGDLMNQWGFVPVTKYVVKSPVLRRTTYVNVQSHDGLLISTPPEAAWDIACLLRESLERERVYGDFKVPLTIWCEFAVARTSWGKPDAEWKKFPTKEEFDATVRID